MLNRLLRRITSRMAGPAIPPPPAVSPSAICHDLKTWAATTPGTAYVSVAPSVQITRRPPQTLETDLGGEFLDYLNVTAPEVGLTTIPGARVLNERGLLALPDGQLIGQTVALTPAGQTNVLTQELTSTPPIGGRPRHLAGNYFSALLIGSMNYYHWLHDVILKIQRVLPHLPADTKFIVPAQLRPFQRESLQLLGVSADRLCFFDGTAEWALERLYVATPYPKPIVETAAPLVWLREQGRAAYGVQPPAHPTRRIFLSRINDDHYCAVNESELIAGLADLNFEVCHPGRLTLAEQVALFAEAACVVGTGTGLANQIFMPPGALIVQWQDPEHLVYALWTLSEALGHRYHTFLAEPVANPARSINNLRVPLDKLRTTLAALS